MKSGSGNVAPPTLAGAKPLMSMDRQTSETVTAASVAKSGASHHHKTAASASAHAQPTPLAGGGLYQRPIRPTQVEPSSGPGPQSSSAGQQSKPQASVRPLMQHQIPQARRSLPHTKQ